MIAPLIALLQDLEKRPIESWKSDRCTWSNQDASARIPACFKAASAPGGSVSRARIEYAYDRNDRRVKSTVTRPAGVETR
jgi:hypothetical protein